MNRCGYCGKEFNNQLFIFSIGDRRYHPQCWGVVMDRLSGLIEKFELSDDEFEKWLKEDEHGIQ